MGWLRKLFPGPPPPEPGYRRIPQNPGRNLWGQGPSYIAPGYDDTGPITDAGDPFAPVVGRTHPTHTQASESHVYPIGDPRPNARVAPERHYRDKTGAELIGRHGVEEQDGDGWTTEGGRKPAARPPYPAPLPERNTPHNLYSFTRPFDQHAEREFNGSHFSMADHRREYPILGMAPVNSRRNTYRVEPTPWDINIVDKVDETKANVPYATMMEDASDEEMIFGTGGTYRL